VICHCGLIARDKTAWEAHANVARSHHGLLRDIELAKREGALPQDYQWKHSDYAKISCVVDGLVFATFGHFPGTSASAISSQIQNNPDALNTGQLGYYYYKNFPEAFEHWSLLKEELAENIRRTDKAEEILERRRNVSYYDSE
jgi:hypothetical protein